MMERVVFLRWGVIENVETNGVSGIWKLLKEELLGSARRLGNKCLPNKAFP
jgi:hypothetical protein